MLGGWFGAAGVKGINRNTYFQFGTILLGFIG